MRRPCRLALVHWDAGAGIPSNTHTCGRTMRMLEVKRAVKYQFIPDYSIQCINKVAHLENILTEEGIKDTDLHIRVPDKPALNSSASFLPLELFDDLEYDCFCAEATELWQKSEAFAFIPTSLHWERVSVEKHHPATNRWEVTMLNGTNAGSNHMVPRLLLYFAFENPCKYADRLKTAIVERREAVNAIRFRFLCSYVFNDGHYAPGKMLEQSIRRRSNSDEVYEVFKRIFEQYHIALAVGTHLNEDTTFVIKKPQLNRRSTYRTLFAKKEAVNFDELLDLFRRKTLLVDKNVFHALALVNLECEMVRKLPLFIATSEQAMALDDFEKQNLAQIAKTMKYLQNTWIERTTMHLHRTLSRIGPGNFNIGVTQWTIYSKLKLKRLVNQIQYRMQDALRSLLLGATREYVDFLVNDCNAVWDIEEDYSWDGNLIDSPFVPSRPAVFSLTLEMGPEAPYYSTEPGRFPELLEYIMDDTVKQSHFIHTVEPSLIQSLIFSGDLYLSSVGLIDQAMVERRSKLLDYYKKALLPLRSYAARYGAYKELFFTDIKEFIERAKSADKPSSEIKEDIALQIRLRENLEHTVPLEIKIGPFLIDVQPLRKVLIRKRQELTVALLKMLTEKLQLKTAAMIADYNAISERICEKPVSIEHIYDIRQYMETVPDMVARMEDRMKGILYEYEILDGFLWNLPDTDFQQKWNALSFPRTVVKQMDKVREFHESEVEKFRKQQFADEASFTASIEDVNVYISKFTMLYDVSKVAEMAVEVRRLWKTLQALIDQGHTMNRRQELFEMAPISLNNLFELRNNFATYRDLWTVAADYLKLEESWIGNPLASVDLEGVRRGLQQAHDSLKDLLPLFVDQPQLLAVVEHFLQVVETFRPNVDIMELLRCPHLEAIHWSQLAKEVGIKGKLSIDVSFDVFLEHGIRGHVGTVRQIVSKAEEQRLEHERRREEEERIRKEQEEYKRVRAEHRLKRTDI
ncbi:dynein axonemal heavy chain 1 [Anopheles ziemanni]|uniref:dynein axonemal heavy chain 1 n=1 Tax=Anopheles coustani TaxID=139045 RepID=UPI002659AB9D|nr:dynein axonemal heavy chain 1 [Anopheles coustani]XP_058168876.1 dynein axonemal heavy chain 1 [Anopheles ziemanni]